MDSSWADVRGVDKVEFTRIGVDIYDRICAVVIDELDDEQFNGKNGEPLVPLSRAVLADHLRSLAARMAGEIAYWVVTDFSDVGVEFTVRRGIRRKIKRVAP